MPSKKIKLDIPKVRSSNHVCFVCCKGIKKESKNLTQRLEQKRFQELASLYLRSQGHVQSILMEVFCFLNAILVLSRYLVSALLKEKRLGNFYKKCESFLKSLAN